MKTCCACKKEKPYTEFGIWKKGRDGYRYRCRECRKAQRRKYNNKDVVDKLQGDDLLKWRLDYIKKSYKKIMTKTVESEEELDEFYDIEIFYEYVEDKEFLNKLLRDSFKTWK